MKRIYRILIQWIIPFLIAIVLTIIPLYVILLIIGFPKHEKDSTRLDIRFDCDEVAEVLFTYPEGGNDLDIEVVLDDQDQKRYIILCTVTICVFMINHFMTGHMSSFYL